jgi:hypothetical protein
MSGSGPPIKPTGSNVQPTPPRKVPKSAHVLWIIVVISLIGAIYYAYLDTTARSSLDMILPKTNITISTVSNTTTVTKVTPKSNILPSLQIPRFIILWGYIGASAYLLKVVTAYLGEGKYDGSYLPFHISRLFIGPALAVVIYFIIRTGSFFGLSFDVTKVPVDLLPYLYAAMAFLTGYFVRQIVETLSQIVNAIFNIKQSSPHTATTI